MKKQGEKEESGGRRGKEKTGKGGEGKEKSGEGRGPTKWTLNYTTLHHIHLYVSIYGTDGYEEVWQANYLSTMNTMLINRSK